MSQRFGILTCMSLSVLGLVACGGEVVPADELELLPEDEQSEQAPSVDEASDESEMDAVDGEETAPQSSANASSTPAANADAGQSASSDQGSTNEVDSGATAALTTCSVPTEARLEDVSKPTTVVGTGTPSSCTSAAFVAAVAKGGVITFNCGPNPVTITLLQTAKVFNDKGPKVVIDGGNKVTLSGGGKTRILYQNTCDQKQVWTTARCDNQPYPELTVQNLTFANGDARADKLGGGAIYAQGGRLKVLNSKFVSNRCSDTGPDVGGGAIRALQQYNGKPVFVVNSTFGGEVGKGNICSNGGALSSIDVSYTVLNSRFSYNEAIGWGANPAQAGTPGGGNGGAIYNDGNTYTLNVCGTSIQNNTAKEGGGGIFMVSNNRTGSLIIKDSTLQTNKSGKFENFPGMFVLAKSAPTITGSIVK